MEIRPISWFSELTPEKFLIFDQMKQKVKESYILSWFLPIETPVVERKETLLSKWGDDNEIYGVHRLSGEKDEAELALRFDLTVPLARYVAQYESQLKFPFKRCHIDRVWRGERAQTGRAREFYQADVDIIGREKLPLFADVEVIFTVYSALKNINFWEFIIHLNNKKILIGYLDAIVVSSWSSCRVNIWISRNNCRSIWVTNIHPSRTSRDSIYGVCNVYFVTNWGSIVSFSSPLKHNFSRCKSHFIYCHIYPHYYSSWYSNCVWSNDDISKYFGCLCIRTVCSNSPCTIPSWCTVSSICKAHKSTQKSENKDKWYNLFHKSIL